MKDCFGTPFSTGDYVLYVTRKGSAVDLNIGRVNRVEPMAVRARAIKVSTWRTAGTDRKQNEARTVVLSQGANIIRLGWHSLFLPGTIPGGLLRLLQDDA